MEAQDLVTGMRWDLLKILAAEPGTGADIAKIINTSPANVSQHLKLLELAGLVSRERVNGKSMHYRVAHETALLTVLGPNPYRQAVVLDPLAEVELRLFAQQTQTSKLLRRFLLEHEELISSFTAFGVVRQEGDIQLLVLSSDVKSLRKDYANIKLGGSKIVIWSHTPQEFQEGLERKEHYFVEMLSNVTIYYDPDRLLRTLKRGTPMNKLARIIEELGVEELLLIRKDVEAGNLLRLIEQRLAKLQVTKTCPTCGSELGVQDIKFAFEFGPHDLRQKAYFDEYDCLQYFLERTMKKVQPRVDAP